ncbi:lytic transglycosylase domain-containing protein [Lysobacter sp. TY2-98]|uniref:lytic transglycosylase domain-containing protein n=1 Tax=Lysobacter sp. TY2-98 TaxID=2290922 RepID=UPI000E208AA1|nr:lytic transglycosylase domain-containing protein [Lysobacter sp. TY2-98]AXK72977.1 lytic transglycosylase domain-containing protein [Lysobacter sp. TY2-98]
MELMGCPDLAVPADVMHHVVHVESSFNPYAIGVVGGRLARQPANLPEAVATARMLESRGFNFSLGLAQVNRYNLARYGLASYEQAFQTCPNLRAGARILAECHQRADRDWGKSFSCYYSGNFTTGFRAGYVQKIYASMRDAAAASYPGAIPVYGTPTARRAPKTAAWRASGEAPSRIEPLVLATPAPAAPVPAATPSIAAPAGVGAPISQPNDDSSDSVVVLRPNGAPPRVADSAPVAPPTPPAPDAPPRDAAFVF